jgi:hypothetical protein
MSDEIGDGAPPSVRARAQLQSPGPQREHPDPGRRGGVGERPRRARQHDLSARSGGDVDENPLGAAIHAGIRHEQMRGRVHEM